MRSALQRMGGGPVAPDALPGRRWPPALAPALGLLAGTWWVGVADRSLVFAAAALVLLGLALASARPGRDWGVAVVAAALGLGAATLGPAAGEQILEQIDPARPVGATVLVVGHPVARGEEVLVQGSLRRLVQGREVHRLHHGVTVMLPPGAAPALGSTLRLRGYLGRSLPLANPGVVAEPGRWRLRVKSLHLLDVQAEPGWLAALSAQVRRRLEVALAIRSPGVDFARALVLGDASRLPADLVRGLRRNGLSHVLSVSGLHLALLVGVAVVVASPAGPLGRAAATVLAVVGYVLAVGPLPALLRSAVMALLVVLALALRRPPVAANALCVAAGGLLLVEPALIGDLGFQLTVAATAGLVFLAPTLAARWRVLPGWLGRPLAASVAAQLATLPLTLPMFPLLAPLGPLVNLLVVPWTGLQLAASLAWTGLATLAPGVARALVPVLDFLVVPLDWLGMWTPQSWWLQSVTPRPWLLVAVVTTAAAAAWWPRRLLLPALAAWSLAGSLPYWPPDSPPGDPQLVSIDVGQGDATLLRDGERAWLIDGGGWVGGDIGLRVLVPSLAELGVRRLDGMIATHGDRDHCGGLADLLFYVPVEQVAVGPSWSSESCLAELASLAGGRLRVVSQGSRIYLGRWVIEVLAPRGDERTAEDNERSVVLVATAGGRRVLLTGDAGAVAEGRLLASGLLGAVDVLKVGHHGSRTASTARFLSIVRPRLALLSVGARNAYGHPAPEVLERLGAAHAQTLRTDRHGQLRLTFRDGGWGSVGIATPLAGAR